MDEKLKERDGHISYTENDYNELKSQYNKQSVESFFIEELWKRLCKQFMTKVYLMLFQMQIRFQKFFCLSQDVDLI